MPTMPTYFEWNTCKHTSAQIICDRGNRGLSGSVEGFSKQEKKNNKQYKT